MFNFIIKLFIISVLISAVINHTSLLLQCLSSQIIGDVANSKRPLLIIAKVQLRLRVTRSWQKSFAGKKKISDCADVVAFLQ